jgi:hypothetical protein
VVNALFWIFVTGHRLILYTNSSGSCWSQEGPYMVFDTFLDVSLSGVGSPLLVIILAIMLWISIRSVTKRHATRNAVGPTTITPSQTHNQQVDLQVTIMLLMQSILAIINYVPFAVYILYYMFTDGWDKSALRVAWEGVIIAFIRLSSYLFAAGTFYISILSNRSFHEQLINSLGKRRVNQPVSIGTTKSRLTTRTITQKPK